MKNKKSRIQVPRDHPSFAGHFPGEPLVPGALLVRWTIAKIEDLWPGAVVTEVRKMKFLHPVTPGAELVMDLTRADNGNTVTVTATMGRQTIFTGRLEVQGVQ